jgi:hypothetical protein
MSRHTDIDVKCWHRYRRIGRMARLMWDKCRLIVESDDEATSLLAPDMRDARRLLRSTQDTTRTNG